MRKTGTGRLWTAAAAAIVWTGAVLSGLLLLPALVCCGLSRLIWSAAERLQNALNGNHHPLRFGRKQNIMMSTKPSAWRMEEP